VTRLRRSAYGTDARLDDLLSSDDAPPAPPEPREPGWVPVALRTVLLAAGLAGALWLVAYAVGLLPPYPLLFAVVLAGVVLRRAARAVAEPETPRPATLVRPPLGSGYGPTTEWHGSGDGLLSAVRRWDRRLERAGNRPEDFGETLAAPLGDLVDERLRQRHGCTRESDPERARSLLGDEAWDVLHGPWRRVPSPAAVVAVVRRMENL
jgi:hypothetical protein